MSSTKLSGGQPSEGFFHWLKNTWLGRLWNGIISCFRPKNKKTESQSASEKQEKNDDNNNGQSQSSEVEQNKVSKPSQNREEVCEDVQKESSGSSQISIDPKSSSISRSQSEISLNSTSLSESHVNRLLRSQSLPAYLNDMSKNDDQMNNESDDLEWDGGYDSHLTFLQIGTQEHSSQPEQNLSSSDTKGEKGNRKRKNDSETNDIPCKISKKEDRIKKKAHRNQTPNENETTDRENSEATERRSKQGQNTPNLIILRSSSSSTLSKGQKH